MLSVAVKSRQVLDEQKKSIPFIMTCDHIVLNGQEYLPEAKNVWHDDPFRIYRPVKDGETVTLSIKWKPYLAQ